MLLAEDFFKTFTKKQIVDATKNTESIICLSADGREKVDEIVEKAIAAGGTSPNEKQDQGFMYGHGFQVSGWAFMGNHVDGSGNN